MKSNVITYNNHFENEDIVVNVNDVPLDSNCCKDGEGKCYEKNDMDYENDKPGKKCCGFKSKKQTGIFFGILLILILCEIGIAVAVIVTQKADSNADYQSQLDVLTIRTIGSIANIMQIFQYSTIRTRAALEQISEPNPFVGQQYFENILQLKYARPSNYMFNFYAPIISNSQRNQFEIFGNMSIKPGFEISILNNTGQLVRDINRAFYIPFTVVDPINIFPGLKDVIGLNAAIYPTLGPLFQNKSEYAIFGVTVPGSVTKANSGIIEASVAHNPDNSIRGYIFGYTDIVSMVNVSVRVDRQYIRAICFDKSVNPSSPESLLFKDVDPMFSHINSASDFYNSPLNSTTKDGTVQAIDRSLYFRFIYNDNLRDTLESKTVLILSIVMATLFLIIDLLFIFFYVRFIQLNTIREMESKALEQTEQLRIAEQQKTETSNKMLGYVNHELRNPLQGIMGLSELSLEDINKITINSQDNVTIKRRLKNNVTTLLKTTEFMKHIIDDILDIRKLEENMVDIHIEQITIHKILKNTYKSIRPKIQEKKGVVNFVIHVDDSVQTFMVDSECEEIDIGGSVIIESDIFRIQQILLNLLSNSFKYTSSGYVHLNVNTQDQQYITFSVVDTGRGIPDEKKKVIFSPFTQTNATDASRYGGIGLGLYLCRMLITLLHGSIGFESQYDTKQPNNVHGSTFWLKLPRKFSGVLLEKTL